jgi:hypothetical protein
MEMEQVKYKREIDTDFRQILALLDMGDKNEEK